MISHMKIWTATSLGKNDYFNKTFLLLLSALKVAIGKIILIAVKFAFQVAVLPYTSGPPAFSSSAPVGAEPANPPRGDSHAVGGRIVHPHEVRKRLILIDVAALFDPQDALAFLGRNHFLAWEALFVMIFTFKKSIAAKIARMPKVSKLLCRPLAQKIKKSRSKSADALLA